MVLGALQDPPERRPSTCTTLVTAQSYERALVVCEAEARRGSAAGALGVASAHLGLEEWKQAFEAAVPLLASEVHAYAAYAAYVAADASNQRGHAPLATLLFHVALAAHEAADEHQRAAYDLLALIGLAKEAGHRATARALMARAASHARLAGDDGTQLYLEIGSAVLARSAGQLSEAEGALDRALKAAPSPSQQAWIYLQLGITHNANGQARLAEGALESALQLARTPGVEDAVVIKSALLNQSYLARREGEIARALALIDEAETYGGLSAGERALNRGAALALSLLPVHLDNAAQQLHDAELQLQRWNWRWYAADLLGQLAERRGRPDEALAAYTRAIAAAEVLRDEAGELAAAVVSTFRESYLRAIGILARRERWSDVLALLGRLDIDDALRIEVAPQPTLAVTEETAELADLVRQPRAVIEGRAIADAWRDRTLIVMISDTTAMWRLVIRNGTVTGTVVGDAGALETSARRLDRHAKSYTAVEADAVALASAIVPAGVAEADVLLVGPIARAPLALIAAAAPERPRLMRTLAILPRPGRAQGTTGARVLGDPRVTLAKAREEAIAVGEFLKTAPLLGADANRPALLSATDVGILHIAAHAKLTDDGPRLELADGDVSPASIQALQRAPRLVVLASCGGVSARDDSGWGSLAAAFLAAGSEYVVASPWTVDDDATRLLVESFYRHGGDIDPPSALAAAQRERAAAGAAPSDWAGFVVLHRPPAVR